MENTYLIDTNILVYAYNEDSEFHEKSLKILENALNKNLAWHQSIYRLSQTKKFSFVPSYPGGNS